jgi:uroporphyrinogen-III synthase
VSGARRVLVTRPRAQAGAWVESLRSHGFDALGLPLIEIAAAPDPEVLRVAWAALPTRRLAMFVSTSAVHAFFDAAPAGTPWPAGVRAAATGPGTVDALAARGVPAAAIDAPPRDAPRFDSEALWPLLAAHDWRGASVLLVRGDAGREWLAERLIGAGATVEALAAYRRGLPLLDDAARRALGAAIDAPARHVWLFASSEAVGNLDALVRRHGLGGAAAWPGSVAVATHPRIAQAARAIGFGAVHEARATLSDVVGCLQSIRP